MKFIKYLLTGVLAFILSPVASSAATLTFNAPFSGNTVEEAVFSFSISDGILPTQRVSPDFGLPIYLYGNTNLNIQTESGLNAIEDLDVSVFPDFQQFELTYLNSDNPIRLGLTADFQSLYQEQGDLPTSSDVIDILTNSENIAFEFFGPNVGSAGPSLVDVDIVEPAVIPAPAPAILLFSGIAGLLSLRRYITT